MGERLGHLGKRFLRQRNIHKAVGKVGQPRAFSAEVGLNRRGRVEKQIMSGSCFNGRVRCRREGGNQDQGQNKLHASIVAASAQ